MCKCVTCGTTSVSLYDERSEFYFCDEQCFREWAEDAGAEIVREFYRELNVSEVDT